MAIILIVSHSITAPINGMNAVATDIITNFGDHKEEAIGLDRASFDSACSPKTELSEIVDQFLKMVKGFYHTKCIFRTT